MDSALNRLDAGTHVGDILNTARHTQDAVVHAGHNLADASLDPGEVAQVGNILAGLACNESKGRTGTMVSSEPSA